MPPAVVASGQLIDAERTTADDQAERGEREE
jgi:hypothetical protein